MKEPIDLTKLDPAPWHVERRYSNGCEIVPRIHCLKSPNRECGWVADCVGAPYLGYESTLVNAEFIVLARNDLAVRQRRGWHTERNERGTWYVKQLVDIYFDLADKVSEAVFEEGQNSVFQKIHDVGLLTRAEAWAVANKLVEEMPCQTK